MKARVTLPSHPKGEVLYNKGTGPHRQESYLKRKKKKKKSIPTKSCKTKNPKEEIQAEATRREKVARHSLTKRLGWGWPRTETDAPKWTPTPQFLAEFNVSALGIKVFELRNFRKNLEQNMDQRQGNTAYAALSPPFLLVPASRRPPRPPVFLPGNHRSIV